MPEQSNESVETTENVTPELQKTDTEKTEENPETKQETKTEEKPEEEVILKVDGKEKKVKTSKIKELAEHLEIDEENAKAILQKELAGMKRLQEAHEAGKKFEQLAEALKEQPEAVLEHLGIDVNEMAQRVLLKKLEESQMTPEQKEFVTKKLEIETKEKEYSEKAKELEEREHKIQVQLIRQEIQDALKDGGIEINDDTMRSVAAKMGEYNQLGKELSAKEALNILRKEYASTLKYFQKEPEKPKKFIDNETPEKKVRKRNSIADFEEWIDDAIDKTRGSTFY